MLHFCLFYERIIDRRLAGLLRGRDPLVAFVSRDIRRLGYGHARLDNQASGFRGGYILVSTIVYM